MDIAKGAPASSLFSGSMEILDLLERVLIYGSIALIPYDLPVFHEACLPLAGIGILLMFARNDLRPFLAFMRHLPVLSLLGIMVCVFSILSLYGNLDEILGSTFQHESGWWRGTTQAILLSASFFFPFYLGFCLRRHTDWQSMIVRAAWWSLPIPLLVGFLQFANFVGVPGLAHLPYVMQYERGITVFRITTVSRESSWFGSYVCVILPFLVMGIAQAERRRLKWVGASAIGVMLLFFFLGFSKSAYIALIGEISVGVCIILLVRRPWRLAVRYLYWLLVLGTAFFAFSILSPRQSDRITQPFVSQAVDVYDVFKPLLLYDTKFVDIATRFGMLNAGISMAKAHPIFGVGLGQFGFQAYNYLPLWGLNSETAGWVANDTSAWPSTSNLYGRLWAETGGLGIVTYLAFRLLIMLMVGMSLLRKYNPDWWRDLAVFSILSALVAFDFHRDSFINMDMWAGLGMALACISKAEPAEKVRNVRITQIWLFFGAVASFTFFAALAMILRTPSAYEASATIIPKSSGIMVTPYERLNEAGFSVDQSGDAAPTARFALMRTFLASRAVSARMIAAHPNLVQRVLGGKRISPTDLAQFIKRNVTILMADNLTTFTLEYRNRDPKLANQFLTETIEETDHAVTAASAVGRQAVQLSGTVLHGNLDSTARESLLNIIAAQELESSYDTAGENANFVYVDRPAVSFSNPSPSPGASVLFSLLLAGLMASVVTVARLLWFSCGQGFERRLLLPLPNRGAA